MGLRSKKTWQDKLRSFFGSHKLDEQNIEKLEDLLIEADIGPGLAMEFSAELRRRAEKGKLSDEGEILQLLADILLEFLQGKTGSYASFAPDFNELQVFMLLGVNGVGKTTSLAKLAQLYSADLAGQMTIGAGDTFRAAAIEQLKVHAERLGCRIVAQQHGSDSAAVIYDAVSSAIAKENKLVLLDTAGRMHTKKTLLAELAKINKVLDKLVKDDQRSNFLVLDATTGSNAMQQAQAFSELVPIKGVILTKLDSQSGGGVIFSLYEKLNLPVLFVGSGEKYDDLAYFDPEKYVYELLNINKA